MPVTWFKIIRQKTNMLYPKTCPKLWSTGKLFWPVWKIKMWLNNPTCCNLSGLVWCESLLVDIGNNDRYVIHLPSLRHKSTAETACRSLLYELELFKACCDFIPSSASESNRSPENLESGVFLIIFFSCLRLYPHWKENCNMSIYLVVSC